MTVWVREGTIEGTALSHKKDVPSWVSHNSVCIAARAGPYRSRQERRHARPRATQRRDFLEFVGDGIEEQKVHYV
jgi:hypothetical protein